METAKIQEGAGVYYLTITVIYWLPVFVLAEPCLIFTESLNYCQQNKNLRINAFVIMPTHTHIIVFDADFDNERLNKTITAMRQFTGRQLANYCHEKMPSVYGQVIGAPRRKDRANQFWQQSKAICMSQLRGNNDKIKLSHDDFIICHDLKSYDSRLSKCRICS